MARQGFSLTNCSNVLFGTGGNYLLGKDGKETIEMKNDTTRLKGLYETYGYIRSNPTNKCYSNNMMQYYSKKKENIHLILHPITG